MKPFNFGEP
jgi:hypothetical protein